MVSEGDAGGSVEGGADALDVNSVDVHAASTANAAVSDGTNGDINEDVGALAGPCLPASVDEVPYNEGLEADLAETPFPADSDGVGVQQEPTLAHCVDVKESTRPNQTSLVANIKVQQGGKEQRIRKEFDVSLSSADIQHQLASQLKVKAEDVHLKVSGREVSRSIPLSACPRDSEGCIEVDAIASVASPRIDVPSPAGSKPAPVTGSTAQGISVVRDEGDKPYLGGYRNKHSGAVFHNACSQTQAVREAELQKPRKEQFCREAQTVEMKARSTQCKREFGTQMPRPDLLLDTSRDVVVNVGSYFSATDLEMKYDRNAVTIQRFARGFIARQQASRLKQSRDELNEFLAKQAEHQDYTAEKLRRREVDRRMRPRTTEDFEVLYNELEAWRLQQTRAIDAIKLSPGERRVALQALLHKETRLLQTIDRLKRGALEDNKKCRVDRMMRNLACPKEWSLMNGRTVSVHTPLTTRARELMHLYHGLTLPLLSLQERLDVLLHVKWTVKEFDCNLTREIVDLIDREADLLNRGRSLKSVDGLRRRISGLFLTFIETPEFNPEAAALQVIPDDPAAYLHQGAELAAHS